MDNLSLFQRLVKTFLIANPERKTFIKEINYLFHTLYVGGQIPVSCDVSITDGHRDFTHDTSDSIMRSGVKITLNKANVNDTEIHEISQFILSDKYILKSIMLLGFDTLVVSGKDEKTSVLYCMKDYETYNCYTLT